MAEIKLSEWRTSDPEGWHITNITSEHLRHLLSVELKKSDEAKAVVFDLDGTLFNVNYRSHRILKDWFESSASKFLPPKIQTNIGKFEFDHVGYSIKDAFINLELDLDDPIILKYYEATQKNWKKKFFDGQYSLEHDVPLAGAASFVQELNAQKCLIVYLSGRYSLTMSKATLLQLEKHGFPVKNTKLVLKSDLRIDDNLFKSESFSKLNSEYKIIANFENEYVNLAAMAETQPNCIHVVVDSPHSDKLIPPLKLPIFRISEF